MSEADRYERDYRRQMDRSAFQSLFWNVLLARKKEKGLTLKGLADKLGINKSYISRSFSSPPNWQIDKISDMADALGVDIVFEARDRRSGRLYTPFGSSISAVTTTCVIPDKAVIDVTSTKQEMRSVSS